MKMYKSSLARGDDSYVGTQDSNIMVGSDEIEEDRLSDADSEEDYEPRFNKAKISETIIFLPFNSFWKFLITRFVTYSYIITGYELVFLQSYRNSRPLWMTEIKYICNVAYLIDTIAAILHIKFKSLAKLRNHKPRPIWQIVIDGFTLFPSGIIADLTKRTISEEVYTVLLLLECIRMYRIYIYFRDLALSVGLNPWRTVLEMFGLMLFLVTHTIACAWFLLTDVKTGRFAEADKLFGLKKTGDWYLICMYYIGTVMTATGFGDLYSATMVEHLLTAFTMVIGFTLKTGLFCGTITDLLVQWYRAHSIFWNKLSLINLDLTTCHKPFSNVMITRLLTYYKRFWVEKGAIKNSFILTTLPTQMRVEVYVDMYWNAINGCRLFRDLDVAYKREIAKYMESQSFMERDVILPQGKLKCMMMFVVHGAIQILSKEDSESPLLALSAGTCLGEVSLLLSYPSVVEINAATYCELQMLSKHKLMQLIRAHPQIGRRIYKSHIEQLERALEGVRDKHSVKDNSNSIIPKRALKELKKSLRNRDQMESQSSPFIWMTEEETNELLSEEEKQKLVPVDKTLADITLDQYRLSTSVKLETDDVCLRTHWPWVFNPNSNFLHIWNWIIVLTVSVACVLVPYYVGFNRGEIDNVRVCFIIIDIVYWFDIYIKLSTALSVRGEYLIAIFQIMIQNAQQLHFVADVVATLPIELVAKNIFYFQDPLKYHLFKLNRILKVHRVYMMFNHLQNGPLWDNTIVRLLKYAFLFLLGSFWMGTVYYMQACFVDETCPKSWVAMLDNKEYLVLKSFYFAVVMISGTGFGDIIPTNRNELVLTTCSYIVALMLFTYLIADFSSMLILKDMPRINFSERVFAISRFMELNSIDTSIRDRVSNFLLLQWHYERGYSIINNARIFYDAPEIMKNLIIIWRRKQYFLGMDLFKGSDMKLIEMLCNIAESYALPPNEVITFAGEVCREFYIVEEGFCESTSNLSQDVNVFGPSTSFNESEMVFGIPGFHNVRTLTHCKMLRITKQNFTFLLNKFPEFNETLNKVKSEQVLDERTVSSIRHIRIIPDGHISSVSERQSWIIHRASTKHRPNMDYERPFLDLDIMHSFIKNVLLRRTIYPSGKFFICWEVVRSIFAIMSGLLFPPLAEMRTAYPNLIYIALVLDITAYVDLYVRMHVCYYNKRGILVSHPWYTCKHYLTHGFALDLFACFPFELLFGSYGSSMKSRHILLKNVLRLNRAFQLHRIISLASYWEQDILKQHKFVVLFKYIPFVIILTHIITCVYIWIHSKYEKDVSNFTPLPNTWLQMFADGNERFPFDLKHPVNYYIISCYWITASLFGTCFGDIVPVGASEMLFSIVVIVIGYMVFTYVTVRIASTHVIYNTNLTLYQEHMSHLINFTKRERITKSLRKEIIEHFENIWQKTHGLRPYQMFEKFHVQLKQDTAMFLYEHTLTSNPLFTGVEKSFFRRLVVLVQERYFVAGAEVISLHDFVTNVHFVHNGELDALDLVGEKRATLRKGNLFGNLERHTGMRLTVPIVASTNVLLLAISTDEFFKLVDDYPIVVGRLHGKGSEELMFESQDHQSISNPILTTSTSSAVVPQSDFLRHATTLAPVAYLILMGCSYLSCGLTAYHLAFESENPSYWVLASSFSLDAILLCRFFLGFFAPYKTDMGELVNDPHLIKKNYINDLFGFWLDLASSFPLEVFALAATKEDKYFVFACLRLIHLLRVFHIVKFFYIRFERLDIHILLYKASSLVLWFFLFNHVASCVCYMIACPRQKCTPGSWPLKFNKLCHESYYTCALYIIIQTFSGSGVGNVAPITQLDMVYNIILNILDAFAIAIFIGSMSAIVANYSQSLVNYNFETNILKHYLRNNAVCGPLKHKVIKYVQMMWKEEKGRQIPAFLVKTPPYLIARFNTEAYGKHLYENFIFSACGSDFLRQLIVFFRRYTFYPGNFVVQQGDMDNSLYFLHHGEVEVIAIGENTMQLIDVLSHGDTFGLSQGVRKNKPHDYTYRASAVTVVLTLKYEHWEHLLRYFPGTRSGILSRIDAVKAPVVNIS